MTNKKYNLTQSLIDGFPLPDKGKRAYYHDEKEAGLVVDVRPSGSKSFYLYKKIDGKPERVFLGQYPDMKIPEARKLCAIKKGEIAHGINPQEEKRGIRQEMTFGEFFNDEYMERYSKLQKKSWEYDIREVNKFLSHWFKRKLSNITKNEVRRLHEEIRGKNGLYQANRILERVRGIYNKAIEWGWDGANPATGIKKYKEVKRDRFIRPDEKVFFFKALEMEENETARDYILISLMTGARKTNVLEMKWQEIDFQNKMWRIPETKNGEPQTIALFDDAVKLLAKRKEEATTQWVFEGEGKTGHLNDPKKSWNRIRQRATLELYKQTPKYKEIIDTVKERMDNANNYVYTVLKLFNEVQKEADKREVELPTGLMDLRIHDLRRTFGSWMAMSGASLPIIQKALGHKSYQSTQVYARLTNDPVRASMETALGALFKEESK